MTAAPVTRPRKRLRVGLLLGLLGAIVVLTVAVFALHRYQVNRNAGGLVSLAREKLDKGRTDEALGLFARYLSYRPDDAPTHAEFARLVIDRAERPGARDGERRYAYNVLDTAVRKNPDDVPLRTRLAEWMLRFGRYGDAAAELTVVEERFAAGSPSPDGDETDLPTIGTLRARALTGLGKYEEAAAAAAAVIGFDQKTGAFRETAAPASDTRMFEATGILATVLDEKLGDTAAAKRVLEHLTATRPDDFRSWVILSDWQRTHGDLPAAAESAKTAARLAPDAAEVLFTNLQIAIDEGRLDLAEQLAGKARVSFPNDERGYRGLAAVALQRRDFERAAAVLLEGLAEKPGSQRLLLFLADVELQAGRLTEAAEALETLTQQGDKNPTIGLLQARLYIARKQWLAAKQKLDEVRPLFAASVAITKQVDLLLGQCHEQLGEFDEQLSANRRVLDEDDKSLVARVGAATALAASGKTADALAEFEAVATQVPADRLPLAPQIWAPLLQLRITSQMRRPAADRDWSRIDGLLDGLAASGQVGAGQLAILRADLLVRKGDVAGATDLLRRQVEADPTAVQPRAALAAVILRTQNPAAAAAVLDAGPESVAADPQLLAVRAQIAAQLSPAEATRILADLEERSLALPAERAAKLLASLATAHKGLGDTASAGRLLRLAAEKSPDSLILTTARFDMACEAGDLAAADELSAEIARLAGPTSPQGRVAAAATLILRVRGQQADRASAATGAVAAVSEENKERLTAAKNLLIEAENDRPGWPQTQQLFAEVAGMQGDIPAAIDRLKQAIALGPTNPATVRQLVSLLYLSNRFQEAQQALATVGSEGLVGMDRLSAEVDLKTGQLEQAVASAERSLAARREQSAGDLLWFGQILARAGKVERAGEVLEQAVDAEPDNRSAWMAVLFHQISTGQKQAAEATLRKIAGRFPPPEGSLLVAQGDEMLGRIADAERTLQEAAASAPDDPAVNRSLAAFYIRRGRWSEARQRLQSILDASPDPATQAWARRALAELIGRAGGYRDVAQAIALIEANVAAGGIATTDDLALAIGLLAPRPEPESWRRAVAFLEPLAKQQPLTVQQRLTRAELHERLGRWDESRIELAALASASDAAPGTLALFVEKLLRHEELDMAGVWLKTLAERAPEAPIVALLRARLALAEKDRPAAVAAVRRLLPEAGDAPLAEPLAGPVAGLAEELGFEQVADRAYSQLAAASADGILARAAYLGRTARGDEALELLESSWSRLPLERLLQTAVAVIRSDASPAKSAYRDRAARLFAKARREDPDSVNVAILDAEFVALGGDPGVTGERYRELLAREDLPPAQAAVIANNLAFLLARPETASEAERLVERALADLGPHPDVLDTRGVVRLAAGRSAEALADLEEAVLAPSATKHLHLACALAAQKRLDAARRSFEAAKRLGLERRRLDAGDQARLETLEATLER